MPLILFRRGEERAYRVRCIGDHFLLYSVMVIRVSHYSVNETLDIHSY